MNRLLYLSLTIMALFASPYVYAEQILHHRLVVNIDPTTDTIAVQDSISLPAGGPAPDQELIFSLNSALNPHIDGEVNTIVPLEEPLEASPIKRYRVKLDPHQLTFKLKYHGSLSALQQNRPSLTQPWGINLDAAKHWYPYFANYLLRFSLQVNLPEGWTALSQGKRIAIRRHDKGVAVQWMESYPQDDIYLIAGPYHEYQSTTSIAEIMVLLRNEDQDLASRYIDATKHYLKLYDQLIGPYPYAKFAMVENSQETGYGMPSFTLLGPTVIRLPFILHSSYPHEILHNWWGNSVYIDYSQGNWSEGLTAYLADHLIQEQQGNGSRYRREALQKYANYVTDQSDFPLSEFRARHGEASQAIGYNKALMFFHMLRLHLGDDLFIKGLRLFYEENRFKHAGYADLRKSFETVSGNPLEQVFSQWIERSGLPALHLKQVSVKPTQSAYILEFRLDQIQNGPAYLLEVPIAIKLDGQQTAFQQIQSLKEKHNTIRVRLPARPVSMQIDPRFDLLRRLHPRELPASLGQVFGAREKIIILPNAAIPEMKEAYRSLALGWAAADQNTEIVEDKDLKTLPSDRGIWLLGWENRFTGQVLRVLEKQDVKRQADQLSIDGRKFNRREHNLVLAARPPSNQNQAIAWLGATHPKAVQGLTRKLPHYSKYSYLMFVGQEPSIGIKGQWEVNESPLRFDFESNTNKPSKPQLPERPSLARFALENPHPSP